jgi:hypothetical protein
VLGLYRIGCWDLKEERRVLTSIVSPKGEERDKAVPDICNICSFLLLILVATSTKGIHYRSLCP